MVKISGILLLVFLFSQGAGGQTTKQTPSAPAAETPEDRASSTVSRPGESPLEIHGFVSQGFLQSTKNNFIVNSTDGTTEFAEGGLTFNKQLDSNLRVGMQVFARKFGRIGNYDAKLDWLLIDYRKADWLSFRAGRIKLPFGLFNDTSDIESARIPILLPTSVYPVGNRDYLLAQTGFEIYGFINLDWAGELEYRIYRGTIDIDSTVTPGQTFQTRFIDIPYIHGGRLIWETPVKGLRFGVSGQQLLLEADLYHSTSASIVSVRLPVAMGVLSAEFANRDFQVVTEYSRWFVDLESSNTTLTPNSSVTSERLYGMATLRTGDWIYPGFYYSLAYPNWHARDNQQDFLKDSAAFVRLDVNPNLILKFEGHYMDGTAGLNPTFNDGRTTSTMERNWGLFLAKATVLF
ncbi:MAG: hypothetical protein AAB250_05910 [Bdellovibrionota bacterium]